MDQQATHGVGGAAYSLLRHQTISTALSLPHHAIFLGDCADPRSDGLDDETSSSLDSNSNGNNFYYSKPIMVLDLIWNLAFVAVSVAVLFSASRERPSTPLRVWVSGYSLQCLLHVGFVYFPYQKRMRTDHDNGDGGSVSNEGLPYLQTHSRISPHSILFPDQDAHQLSQCVFGYICFVHDHTSGKDKLQPKSIKCVFLGYSRLQKGYKCYNPLINKYFVSTDVTFFETSSYFSSNTASKVQHWLLMTLALLHLHLFRSRLQQTMLLLPLPSEKHYEKVGVYQYTDIFYLVGDWILLDCCRWPNTFTRFASSILVNSGFSGL
ncbi:uncharacterized protein LOC110656064 isoform X8 [Hevea brasiliensis]|uniref:uncharacterized protein LOC110656064 isoform X8 n=1 Tax=Hevea brasiliensis TaxID=3981 RepID=UPI0025E59613|nr:uncharacterized protein LOC110656064 isoform X8 [Hevea brasiliensis]